MIICYIGKCVRILNELQNLEKCDRQKEDGRTDNASNKKACASKKSVWKFITQFNVLENALLFIQIPLTKGVGRLLSVTQN